MTTNSNLLPGTLIEYKSAHSLEQAWVIAEPMPAHTEGMVKIRVKGETGINMDTEFNIYVKAKGRAKILEMTDEAAAAELNRSSNKLRRELLTEKVMLESMAENSLVGQIDEHLQADLKSVPLRTGSHKRCYAAGTHDNSKAGRAACRKAHAKD